MGMISQEQFDRIAERARDVTRRTYGSGAEAAAKPVDLDDLMADFEKHAPPAAKGLLGMVGKLGGMLGLEGMVAMGPDGPIRFGGEAPAPDLSAAPDEARLAEAERRIGRSRRSCASSMPSATAASGPAAACSGSVSSSPATMN